MTTKTEFSLGRALQEILNPEELMNIVIKYIINSPDARETEKKFVIFLLRKSEFLTKKVWVELYDENVIQFSYGIHDMLSSGRQTHINNFLKALGYKLHLWFGNSDQGKLIVAFTIKHRDIDEAEKIKVHMRDLEKIKL